MKTLQNNCIIAAKNEIASLYLGLLNAKVTDTVIITPDSIRTRIKRKKIHVPRCTGGLYSPLLSIEAGAIEVMKQMARIRASLTPSDGLRLINSSIVGTEAQEDLIDWKQKYSHIRDNVDQVGATLRSDV